MESSLANRCPCYFGQELNEATPTEEFVGPPTHEEWCYWAMADRNDFPF